MTTTTLRPVFLAALVSVSIGLAQADDENRSGAFGISLPSVNDSAFGYGKNVSGAVSDKLYYTLGGGSVISQPATRSSMRKLGMDIGWSSDLMCGNFDLKTTVGNQLNGVTSGYKNLMSDVIQGATGAVASLPAMVIQRANPGLYDMLTNGVLQGSVAFDKAQLNCQNMSKRMMNFAGNNKWNQSAVMDEYKSLVNSGDADAVRVNNASEKLQGKSGQNWIGGQKRGGQNQPAIRPTHDLAAAGYNMMNSLPVLSTTPVSNSSCNGGACAKYGSAEEAAKAVVQVVGDSSLRTCGDASQCTSGDDEQQPGATQAGTGFAPILEETTKENTDQLVKLVNGSEPPNAANLAKLKTGSLPITAGVIRALQRDPDNAALTARLAGELAMADTVETALIMRRMIVTGMSEPNAASQTAAIEEGDRRVTAIDREITALRNEMELKRELSRNSVLTIIERENGRVNSNPQTQSDDNTDSRMNRLAVPETENK